MAINLNDPNFDWVKVFQQRLNPTNAPSAAALDNLRAGLTGSELSGLAPGLSTDVHLGNGLSTDVHLGQRGLSNPNIPFGGSPGAGSIASSAAQVASSPAAARANPQSNSRVNANTKSPQTPMDTIYKNSFPSAAANIFRTPLGTADSSWWKSYVPAELGILAAAGNEQQADYSWGQNHGYGQFTQGALSDYANPHTQALLQGITDPQKTLDFYGQFNQQALTPGAQTLDPRSIMQRVLSASATPNTAVGGTASTPDPLGIALYGSQHPEDQVSAVIQFVKPALQGVMSQEGINAYLQYLTQQGQAFVDWKMRHPTLPGNFGRWVLDRSGGGVGF